MIRFINRKRYGFEYYGNHQCPSNGDNRFRPITRKCLYPWPTHLLEHPIFIQDVPSKWTNGANISGQWQPIYRKCGFNAIRSIHCASNHLRTAGNACASGREKYLQLYDDAISCIEWDGGKLKGEKHDFKNGNSKRRRTWPHEYCG